ncbi:hypothetical protein M0802_007201 [Mischocyttarus mexicanus]|nr:hypothetical protein M0802_007201 [Mischocyttarus mexicanus]
MDSEEEDEDEQEKKRMRNDGNEKGNIIKRTNDEISFARNAKMFIHSLDLCGFTYAAAAAAAAAAAGKFSLESVFRNGVKPYVEKELVITSSSLV